MTSELHFKNPSQRRSPLRQFCLAISLCLFASSSVLAETSWKSAYDQGQSFLNEQKPVDAEKCFRRAISLAQSGAGSATNVDECQMKLADTLALRSKTGEANAIYRQLLSRLVKRHGESKQIVPVLNALGSIQESLGDHTAAISYYQRALRINQKTLGPYSPAFAENLHSLARANSRVGNKKTAEKQYKQSISILMMEPSLSASDRLQSVMVEYTDLLKSDDDSNKSLIDDYKKDILSQPIEQSKTPVAGIATSVVPEKQESATPELRPLIGGDASTSSSEWQKEVATTRDVTRQSQMNSDPQIAERGMKLYGDTTLLPAYKVMSDTISDQGRYGQGADYYQRMIGTDLNALGPHHPSVGNDLNGLAHFYIHQKDYGQAEPLLLRASSIYKQAYGERNALSINTCTDLAFVEFHLGKIDKATELYQKALSNSQSTLGPDSFETARVLNELAYLYFHQGKLKEASTTYKWAVASTEAAVGQQSPLLAACLRDYALVLRSLGEPGEAGLVDGRAQSIWSKQPKVKS